MATQTQQNLEEENFHIPTKELCEDFVCVICFETIRECSMTPCGHNFCRSCILECLNIKHICPICKETVVKTQLIKNHHFDKIISTINELKKKARKNYFQKLIGGDNTQITNNIKTSSTINMDGTIDDSVSKFSPFEKTFKKHHTNNFNLFNNFFLKLQATLEERQQEINSFYANEMASLNLEKNEFSNYDKINQLKDNCQKEQRLQMNEFDKTVTKIAQIYDNFLSTNLPNPTGFPFIITLHIQNKNIRFNDIELQPNYTTIDLRNILKQKLIENNDDIKEFTIGNTFVLHRLVVELFGKIKKLDDPIILEESRTLTDYKIDFGCHIFLQGDVILLSDAPKKCFKLLFNNENKVKVDYFTCIDCKLNWLCKQCTEYCHSGHKIKNYTLNHLPTWACCYCSRSKKCQLC
eukprot:TRINITY_DN8111_c0_g1_i1.p1 TRINITY_DN8111_c0_g1~~TRINITY_DN8111_c0_g1_i1.p1  ORF type:complete len:409 (+),score=115.40 TRINITY_DN8111_c0_g1_i1:53-1279(+)